MSVLLGLLAAVTYGGSDFFGGIASRRLPPGLVAALVLGVCVLVGAIGVVAYPGDGPSQRVVLWGLATGVAIAVATLSLYRGLSVGEMSVVATVSGLLSAMVPVVVGLATGDSLSAMAAIGIVAAFPAIGLVSWQPEEDGGSRAASAFWGFLAGLGFGTVLVGYDQAGSNAGAWPTLIAEAMAVLLVAGPALRVASLRRRTGEPVIGDRGSLGPVVLAGVLAGAANLSFLIATHHGELAIVGVLTSLYPGVTVVLARVFLGERWSVVQKVGLLAALGATLLVSLGS
jgi:drug/metabolite transporter (DMT)-like permease